MQKDTKKQFPWKQEYFLARIVLGFSEEEFWQSSPRKIHALKGIYDKYFGHNNGNKTNLDQIQEIQALLNQ